MRAIHKFLDKQSLLLFEKRKCGVFSNTCELFTKCNKRFHYLHKNKCIAFCQLVQPQHLNRIVKKLRFFSQNTIFFYPVLDIFYSNFELGMLPLVRIYKSTTWNLN